MNFVLKMMLPVVGLFLLTACGADNAALEKRVTELETKLAKFKEIQEITARKVGLGALVPYETVPVGDGFVEGDEKAAVIIMEFTDLQCPYCRTFHDEVYPKIKEKLVDTGKVLFVARDFPLLKTHKQAGYAAVALRCAREQNQYHAAKAYLFEHTGSLVPEKMHEDFKGFGVDTDKLKVCMDKQEIHSAVQQAFQFGMELGLQSTPSFLVGKNVDGKVTNFKIVTGAGSLEQFEKIIAELK